MQEAAISKENARKLFQLLIEFSGLSNRELADALQFRLSNDKINESGVAKCLAGKHGISYANAKRIAQRLMLNVMELIELDEGKVRESAKLLTQLQKAGYIATHPRKNRGTSEATTASR